jgi:hypothetical protein
MKNFRFVSSLCLVFALLSVPLVSMTVRAQDPQVTAIMRGYRTGYSDGYQSGISDQSSNGPREFRNKKEYEQGDRAYNAAYGSPEEYRDGYQQGFEVGYNAGFDRKPFDSSIPADLKRRSEDSTVNYPIDQNDKGPVTQPQTQPQTQTQSQTQSQPLPGGTYTIPRDTIILVELMGNLSTEASQKGDRFQAKVLDPKEYGGAILEGQVMLVKRPGKAKGTAQLQLGFEEIRFPDGRRSKLSAQVIEVIPNGSSEGVGKVDAEGGVQGKDSTKSDVKKVGAAAGIGAVLGAIFGGGTGAVVGATIGAGTGTAGVLSERGRDLHLSQGQQMRIRTAGDAEVQ